jgi:hypothetical protein
MAGKANTLRFGGGAVLALLIVAGALLILGVFSGSHSTSHAAVRSHHIAKAATFPPKPKARTTATRFGFHLRYGATGHRRVEANLSTQRLAFVNPNGTIRAVLHTSSGKPSTPTVTGRYYFYMKQPGYNEKGMLDSVYFYRGYAIHGYFSVPDYAASHGCLRIALSSASWAMNWLQIGDQIDVYH